MTIHYFKDGDLNYSYENSWRRFCPDAEFKHWHSGNLPVDKYPVLQKYIDAKKWSVLSDFVRRYSIYTEGGIYLDYDVELIAPIDFLNNTNFVCIEGHPIAANTAVCGGKKENIFFKNMLDELVKIISKHGVKDRIETELGCGITTRLIEGIKSKRLKDADLTSNQTYTYGGDSITTLSKDFFFPYNWNEKYNPNCITNNTKGIHWWKKGW